MGTLIYFLIFGAAFYFMMRFGNLIAPQRLAI